MKRNAIAAKADLEAQKAHLATIPRGSRVVVLAGSLAGKAGKVCGFSKDLCTHTILCHVLLDCGGYCDAYPMAFAPI